MSYVRLKINEESITNTLITNEHEIALVDMVDKLVTRDITIHRARAVFRFIFEESAVGNDDRIYFAVEELSKLIRAETTRDALKSKIRSAFVDVFRFSSTHDHDEISAEEKDRCMTRMLTLADKAGYGVFNDAD
jgi:hypothetical protein